MNDGPGLIAAPKGLVRDSRGRLYVTSPYFRGEIKVYDSLGVYMRHVTRRGAGPGEADGAPEIVITSDDRVHVFDARNTRYSVFSSDYRLLRDTILQLPFHEVADLTGGRIAISAVQSKGRIWTVLHMVDTTGSVIHSLGLPAEESSAATSFMLSRRVARGQQGRVWMTTHLGDYVVEEWNESGRVRYFRRDAPWYTPSGPNAALEWRPGVTPPPAMMMAINQDSVGRLWTIAAVAKRTWRSAFPRSSPPEYLSSPPEHLMFDMVLEVLDPVTPAVITRQRFELYGMGFVGDDLYTYAVDPNGEPAISIWRVRLRDPSNRKEHDDENAQRISRSRPSSNGSWHW